MRARPVLWFSLLSAMCLAVLGLAVGRTLAGTIHDRALVNAQRTAEILANEAIRPQLRASDLAARSVPAARRAVLRQVVAAAKTDGNLARIKVWSRSHRVVFSDDASVIGRHFEIDDELQDALEGKPFVGVTDADRDEQAGERGLGQLVEVYVPLRFGAERRPTGAFELYAPYAPVRAAIVHDERRLAILLAVGLLATWLVLHRIVARLSRALRRQNERSRHEAEHDPLTGLPNRRLLYERLDHAIVRARRRGGSCALMIVDLDGFKELNDTLGHPVGDGLLRDLGPRLEAALGAGQMLARLGGDEFAIVLDAADGDEPGRAARAIGAVLDEPFELDGLRVRVAASIGIARSPRHGHDTASLMRRADVAMYQAKRGRAGWAEYDVSRDGHSRERLEMADELRLGIERGELRVVFQPQGDLASGRVTGVEALVRWQHPERGLLAPAEFLQMAEQAGLMRALTLCVLERSLDQLLEWNALGLELTVSVNLSVPDLLDARIFDDLADELSRTAIDPGQLVLEITEDTVMSDPERCAAVLQGLAALGVTISLDDFGTGYSSLTHLKELGVDELKIDRSFVSAMRKDPRDAAIVRTVIELGRALGMRVVAEGVEDGETWRLLAAAGCDGAQGWFVSRPALPEDLTPRLLAAAAAARVSVR